MPNIFETIGHDAKVVGQDIAHVVKEAVLFPVKGAKVVETITEEYPQLKPELMQIVVDGKTVAETVAAAIGERGLNWADDVNLIHQVSIFFNYFMHTFVPKVEQVYSELNTDVADTVETAVAPAS